MVCFRDFWDKDSVSTQQVFASMRNVVLLVVSCGLLTACSTTGQDAAAIADPFEDVNRVTLSMNEAVDKAVLEPVARSYRAATPGVFRAGMRNFLRNLRGPIDVANQVLQGDVTGFGNSLARVVINTLAGFGGVLDIAEEGGIAYEREDFGQTLATWGIGDGAYFVVPILGPSSLRDGFGLLVDSYADPLRLYLFNTDQEAWHYARVGAGVVSTREELIEVIDDLRQHSFDYYAAVRSAYQQRRQALINDQDPELSSGPEIPDYDDF